MADLQQQHDSYEVWNTAREKAQSEPTFDNARAAGIAWGKFLSLFGEKDQGAKGDTPTLRLVSGSNDRVSR